MMNNIRITKNPNGDTRTAPKNVTFEQFQEANQMHISDVKTVMTQLSYILDNVGRNHDFTKVTRERDFYNAFLNALEYGDDFVESDWYQMHVAAERHHLLANCPNDVNLIDILEMLADCVCAGLARSGEVRPIELNDIILKAAVENTVKLMINMIEVIEPGEITPTIQPL